MKGSRVLIADGDALAAAEAAGVFGAAGCGVAVVGDGLGAASLLEADPRFDLLVTDLRLPGLDGAGLIRRVRRVSPWHPALVLTGTPPTGGPAALKVAEEGPLFLLAKPALPAALLACAARAVCRAARPWIARCPMADPS